MMHGVPEIRAWAYRHPYQCIGGVFGRNDVRIIGALDLYAVGPIGMI